MTPLPTAIRTEVEAALSDLYEKHVHVDSVSSVGGGCINPAARVRVGGAAYFLKWNADAPKDFFAMEAASLNKLRDAGSSPETGDTVDDLAKRLRVPDVLSVAPGWLLLEFVERGEGGDRYSRALGTGLAELHARTANDWAGASGADQGGPDNFIGSLPQANAPCADWATFWWERRLAPQIERARAAGHLGDPDGTSTGSSSGTGISADIRDLHAALPEILSPADEDGYSLLHGDLWSGNVFPDPQGTPVLVDPSSYRGHREVDLAMTELFGGFERTFYEAYTESWPLLPGYRSRRRDAYQLYPLLVHLNLFGASYEAGVRQAIGRLLPSSGTRPLR
jgi:protein-ribulosamine 3-kinase